MKLALGLMSGTSCDGVSAALTAFTSRTFRLVAYRTYPYPAPVAEVLRRARELAIKDLAALNTLLGELFAFAAIRLLRAARVAPRAVSVIGSHGHTVYHGPADRIPSTLQFGEPAIIAERTGCPVAANFRARDLAAGGQGAPLVPFFDQHFFGHGSPRALQNIGGIANVTVVGRSIRPLAFDTGPGNCLIDVVARRLTRGVRQFDPFGRLARRGRIDHAAVTRLSSHPYFHTAPPKSTGPELFNEQFLTQQLGPRWTQRLEDTLTTLTYLTAYTIAESYRRFVPITLREVIVSGGGTLNRTLITHLAELLDPIPVRSIAHYGLHPQAKEPVAFAFLGLRTLHRRINHLPSTTGATRACVLGTLVP